MDFKDYLNSTADQINFELEDFFESWIKEVEKVSSKLLPLAKAFIKACQGGKRIRGTLVKLGYEIGKDHLGGVLANRSATIRGDTSEIIKVGAAYEIFHASILAHDDIIDQSPLRRGQPTLYKVLGGDHHGISQTIALGDLGFFLATKAISESNFPIKEKDQALAWFSKTMIATALGQMLDVELPHLGGKRKEEDVISIHTLKTAQYTISGPLILGAILAGFGPTSRLLRRSSFGYEGRARLRWIKEFGEYLGIAFQIQDDILGVFGEEDEIGKPTTDDIEEGKNTLLITEALKRANPAQRKILNRYYGKGDMGNERDRGLKAVRQIFLQTGSLDYSQQFGVKYVTGAKKLIPLITRDKKMVRILTEMADFLVERSK